MPRHRFLCSAMLLLAACGSGDSADDTSEVSADRPEDCLTFDGDVTLENLRDVCADDLPVCVAGNVFEAEEPSRVSDADLAALGCVVAVDGDVNLIQNEDLGTLDGLAGLVTVGGSVTVQSNPSLENLLGLSSLRTIGGDLTLTSNSNLDELEPGSMAALETVGGSVRLYRSYADFPALTTIRGDLDYHESGTTLGFNALTRIEGSLLVIGDSYLHFIELNALTEVGADLVLDSNYSIWEHGMPGLQTVGGRFELSGEPMDGVPGLGSLSRVGSLSITYLECADIELPGLETVDSDVYIAYNRFLAPETAEAFVDRLSVGGDILLEHNGEG